MCRPGITFALLGLVTAIALLFLVLPILLISWASFTGTEVLRIPPQGYSLRWYGELFSDDGWRAALANSLVIAATASLLATFASFAGVLGLLGVGSGTRRILVALFLLPMAFPVVALAVGQLMAFESLRLGDGRLRLVVAHLAICVPTNFLILQMTLFGPLHRYARLGLTFTDARWYIAMRLIIPLMGVQIVGAALVAFLLSFDEPVLSLFLGSPGTETIPRLIYNGLRFELDPTAAAVTFLVFSLWLIVAIILIVAGQVWAGDRGESNAGAARI